MQNIPQGEIQRFRIIKLNLTRPIPCKQGGRIFLVRLSLTRRRLVRVCLTKVLALVRESLTELPQISAVADSRVRASEVS